jgi:Protein of unknown function (DUF1501)
VRIGFFPPFVYGTGQASGMRRRSFLGLVGGAAGAAALLRSRRAEAAFGTFPTGTEQALLPVGMRAKNVLEIFLYGGLSPWETLYCVPTYGTPTDPMYPNQQSYTFKSASDAMIATCGNTAVTAQSLGTDALGAAVQLGPFAAKLSARLDVVQRLRVVVQKHNLEPHEAAVPQALTGRPVGQPTAAGLGAHVQRAKIDADTDANTMRSAPYSYMFATGGISSDNVAAAAAAGAHPGYARPLLIKTDNAAGFTSLLSRPTVANRGQQDALVKAYVDQYQQRLTWPNQGRVRSPRTDDLAVAFQTTTNVDAIATLLKTDSGGDLFANIAGSACAVSSGKDIPFIGLNAAVHLLTHPDTPAAYVCVSDTGIEEASGGGGYDTHTANAHDTAMNFDNMLQALLAKINGPSEGDAKKLNLDDTMIILNTEFGRTPVPQGGDGRNHHPYGYATAFIGGPITGTSIAGAIGPDGTASGMYYATPAQNRMAALLALGIWPFAQEAFAVSDVPGATAELAAALSTIKFVLGRTL